VLGVNDGTPRCGDFVQKARSGGFNYATTDLARSITAIRRFR